MGHNDSWREKYLDALDEQEKLTNLNQVQAEVIRRLVVNLSAAAAGLDEELDSALVTLKDKLRGAKGTAVHDQLLHLEAVVSRYEERKIGRQHQLGHLLRDFAAELNELSLPTELSAQMLAYTRQFIRQPPSETSLVEHLNQLQRFQQQAIRAAQLPALGLWQRLRGGRQLQGAVVELPQTQDASEMPVQALDEPSWNEVNREILKNLEAVMLELKGDLGQTAPWQQLQTRLPQLSDWQQLVVFLKELHDLLRGRSKVTEQTISDYLSHINGELHNICSQLGLDLGALQLQEQAAQHLDQAVTEHMTAMRKSLDGASELDDLKQHINGQIALIHQALNQFKQQTQARPVSDELQILIDKVKHVEAESERTQALLEQERHRANHDSLTGLPNREAYKQRAMEEWHRFTRYGRTLSIAVVDIDHFKQLNDRFGHRVGDRVLRLVAQSLVKRLRAVDFVARYGGEEFVVLLPETQLAEAQRVMDSARQAIAESAFRFKTQPVHITFSCGITCFREGDSFESAFQRADMAMYRAKETGRNRICTDA